jgi:hypothetical protein
MNGTTSKEKSLKTLNSIRSKLMNAKQYDKLSNSEQKKEDWMNTKWRPMMGWTYMLTCISDFVLFPILWSFVQSIGNGQVNMQWQPLTLQGAGLFHISMGAILGIAVYGRTKEKLGGVNNGGISLPSNVGTTYTPPGPVEQQSSSNFGTPVATTVTQTYRQPKSLDGRDGSRSSSAGNNSFSEGIRAETFTSKSGKLGPVQYFPEI